MVMVLSVPQLNLLQENVRYFKEDDPVAALILLVGIIVVVVAGLIGQIIKRGISIGGPMGQSKSSSPRQFSGFVLRRVAKSYDLNRDQTKLLEQIFRKEGVSDPKRIMTDFALLDKYFKRAFKSIERTSSTEGELQQRLSLLFSLRNTIENAQGMENPITATNQIAANSEAVLIVNQESYPVRIISSQGENMSVECPRNVLGSPIRINKGTRVSLVFFTKSAKRFSFDTRVVGRTDTSKGATLQLAQSFRVKNMTQRKSRRKQAIMSCSFYLVFIEESGRGRKKKQKMILDKRKMLGTILDISVGGCAIKTSSAIMIGSRLKIEFTYADDQKLAVLGQVLRTNRSGMSGTIMHIKFLKVPRRAWNTINAVVFEYDEA
jgi:c-di-GMP-binding flagellar brake protein YcgR